MSARKATKTKEVEKKRKKVIFTTIIQLGLFFCGFSGCPLRLELPINEII